MCVVFGSSPDLPTYSYLPEKYPFAYCPVGGSEWLIRVGDNVDNSFTALGGVATRGKLDLSTKM